MAESDYQKKCEEYESILGIGEFDLAKKAFISFCRVVHQQSERLNKFKLDTEIVKEDKADKVYDRTMDIVIKMPKMISDIHNLRKELGISNTQIEEAFTDGIADKRK